MAESGSPTKSLLLRELYDLDLGLDESDTDSHDMCGDIVIERSNEDIVRSLRDKAQQGDQRAFYDRLKQHLNMWTTVPLRVAVIGQSGSGKSSYINALRGIGEDDEGAAEVGVTETTTTVREYPHPTHKNLLLFDLPGVGTRKFPKESYLKEIDIGRFDFFLVLSESRFTENDMWIAKEISKRGQKFYFVRTKIDNDVRSDSRKKNRRPDDTMNQVRWDIEQQLLNKFETVPHIFLISNHDTDKFDFNKLTMQMVNDMVSGKRDAFVLALVRPSKDLFRKKREVLGKRIDTLAIASAISGVFPLPGVNRLVGIAIIKHELAFYKEQFGTDEQSVKDINDKFGISFEDLFTSLPHNSSMLLRSTDMLYELIFEKGQNPDKKPSNAILKVLRGLGGNHVGAYHACKEKLMMLLDMCENEAIVLNTHVVDRVYPDQ